MSAIKFISSLWIYFSNITFLCRFLLKHSNRFVYFHTQLKYMRLYHTLYLWSDGSVCPLSNWRRDCEITVCVLVCCYICLCQPSKTCVYTHQNTQRLLYSRWLTSSKRDCYYCNICMRCYNICMSRNKTFSVLLLLRTCTYRNNVRDIPYACACACVSACTGSCVCLPSNHFGWIPRHKVGVMMRLRKSVNCCILSRWVLVCAWVNCQHTDRQTQTDTDREKESERERQSENPRQ